MSKTQGCQYERLKHVCRWFKIRIGHIKRKQMGVFFEMNETFSLSFPFFWIRGSIQSNEHVLHIRLANRILGCIPFGQREGNIMLSHITECSLNTRVDMNYMFVTLLSCICSPVIYSTFREYQGVVDSNLPMLMNYLAAGILLIGICYAIAGIKTELSLIKAGNNLVISVPIYERKKMQRIYAELIEKIRDADDKK